MQAANQRTQEDRHLAHPYWLAFLLTGNSDVSVRIVCGALDDLEDVSNAKHAFQSWQFRRVIVERSLLVDCAQPVLSGPDRQFASSAAPERSEINCESLTSALFALDLLPRRILLLTVFEGHSLAEAACLLALDVDRIADIRAAALSELMSLLTSHPNCCSPAGMPLSSEGGGPIKGIVTGQLHSL